MSTQPTAVGRAASRGRTVPLVFLSYLALGTIAFLARALDLGVWINFDEANYWLKRSDIFFNALRTGDLAATAVTSHPGVTTMWLGSAGIILRRLLVDTGLLPTTFPTTLALMRLPVAITHVVALLIGYGMLRRMLPATMAALGAFFWATDPFVVGYSRLLHVDGLAATFSTLSLLAACLYWFYVPQRRWLLLSATCAALAFLSKLPGLIVVPIVGVIALSEYLRKRREGMTLRSALAPYLLWCGVCAVVAVVVWPAILVAPDRIYELARYGVETEGLTMHKGGNFFLGEVTDHPSLLFYPLALMMRLTPWTLLGVLLAPLAWRHQSRPARQTLWTLAGYALLFVVAMGVFVNKLNRYLVPAFPAFDILAGAGIVAGLGAVQSAIQRRLPVYRNVAGYISQAIYGVVVVAALLNVAWWHPYGVSAFNQLFGGHAAGARTFLVGSGEGMGEVAAWLNEQADITDFIVIAPQSETLAPFLREGATVLDILKVNPDDLPQPTRYVVDYIRLHQQDPRPELITRLEQHVRPETTISIKGVEYARIYQVPPAVDKARPTTFGTDLHLHGFSTSGPARRGQPLSFRLVWESFNPPPADYMFFIHVIAPDGQRFVQPDLALPTRSWWPQRYNMVDIPLAIPADAPVGTYQITAGMYDLATGQRLPVRDTTPADPALDGPDVLLLTEMEVE